MNPTPVIRDETDADAEAIAGVTVAAFETLAISGHTEQFIVEALRAAGALAVSLVAEADGRVVGHVAFSPVAISDGSRGWYGLVLAGVPPEVFFALSFGGGTPRGTVAFHEGFKAEGPMKGSGRGTAKAVQSELRGGGS